jgi:hypothetical protein
MGRKIIKQLRLACGNRESRAGLLDVIIIDPHQQGPIVLARIEYDQSIL